jgi:hypothetical protein
MIRKLKNKLSKRNQKKHQEDDGWLYHASGMYYMDGDEVDEKGLFLPNGKPADLNDFKERYYTEPPENWAKQFPEYDNYTLSQIVVKDNKQLEAEELIKRGEKVRSKELESNLIMLKPYLNKNQNNILGSIRVYIKGLPTLNGFATYSQKGERYIVLHAGLDVILSNLGTFISNMVWRKDHMVNEKKPGPSLISLAKFIGSYGVNGSIAGAWEPQSADNAEGIANAFIDQAQSIFVRETLIQWILAHECSHHIFKHLYRIEEDLKRCHNAADTEHYSLRQELEFDADLKAIDLVLKMENIHLTKQARIEVIDHLLVFMCFVDIVLKEKYSEKSTHPSSMDRLLLYRKYIDQIGEGFSDYTNTWSNILNSVIKDHKDGYY